MRALASLPFVALVVAIAPIANAIVGQPSPRPEAPSREARNAEPTTRAPTPEEERRSKTDRIRDRWLISVEGVVHAPSDLGFQAGVELPFRMRIFTGFGFIPADQITNFVSNATSDPRARLVLALPSYSGNIWRAQVGFRPFKNAGLYLDGGYARATIRGDLDFSGTPLENELGSGGYRVRSSLDLWLLELGYQWEIARRGVIGIGGGVLSTFNADTRVQATGGAPSDSRFTEGAEQANRAFESYGTIPTLTLRLGVDLL